MTSGAPVGVAESIARVAVSAVLGSAVVASARADTLLVDLGYGVEDAVCVARAVREAAAECGAQVELDDADVDDVHTLGGLIVAVEDHLRRGEDPHAR